MVRVRIFDPCSRPSHELALGCRCIRCPGIKSMFSTCNNDDDDDDDDEDEGISSVTT